MSNKDQGMVDKAWVSIIRSGVRAGQLWKHNKTDSTYRVVAMSVDEARLIPVVTYEGHPNNERRTWTRDLDVFTGKREDDGSFRFTRVDTPQSLCPKQVFVDDGWPAGQCLRKPNHEGLCDVYNGDQHLDPGRDHYERGGGRGCVTCGSFKLRGEGMGCEIFRYVCLTCGADPA